MKVKIEKSWLKKREKLFAFISKKLEEVYIKFTYNT